VELHLDLIGGLAGDMFIAALLDAFPTHESAVLRAIESTAAAGQSVNCALTPCRDGILSGRRFSVSANLGGESGRGLVAATAAHSHTDWSSIRERLHRAPLTEPVIRHAVGIFSLLAEAEAGVHGVPVERVAFHEVGAWDSIADIVGAATLIDALRPHRWTASAVPLGSGRVRTAHGILPVPAPATARLLLGMPTLDDGIAGERVTPTGAAILRYVCPPPQAAPPGPVHARTLVAGGTGFGARKLPNLSNHVRVLAFESLPESAAGGRIEVLEFEVDDQAPEDLAAGLDRLRNQAGVFDVTQVPVFGKKGRMMMHVQVLARPEDVDTVIETCFRETTTLGLRRREVHKVALTRRMEDVHVEGHRFRVKIADRPGGRTAKAESDDALPHESHARRAILRRRAESAALETEPTPHA